jgi:hypothetical protein
MGRFSVAGFIHAGADSPPTRNRNNPPILSTFDGTPTREGQTPPTADMLLMRLRLSLIAFSLVAFSVGSAILHAAGNPEYAAVTARIFQRIGALERQSPAVDWTQEVKKAKVMPDGVGGLAVEHGVEWVIDRPDELPSKLNGARPVYKPGGFWFRLTFFRGPWKGAAVFQSIDFGDLHLWFESGSKDNVAIIRAVAQIIEEEHRAFEAAANTK